MRCFADFQRDPFGHSNPCAFSIIAILRRVVGQQLVRMQSPAISEYPNPVRKSRSSSSNPRPVVGLNRVKALILQEIGAHLVGQPDAPPFLVEIQAAPLRPRRPSAPSAAFSCGPQSHFRLPIRTSPVKQAECKPAKHRFAAGPGVCRSRWRNAPHHRLPDGKMCKRPRLGRLHRKARGDTSCKALRSCQASRCKRV